MPAIVPFIPLIAAGIGAATAGVSMYESHKSAEEQAAEQQKMLRDQAQAQSAAQAEQQKKMIQANLANAQEQGGGSLTDTGTLNLSSILSGLPGQGQTPGGPGAGALAAFLGTGTPGSSSGASGGENMVSSTYGLSGNQG